MKDKLRLAFKEQMEARAAFNAVADDAPKEELEKVELRLADADKSLVALLEEPDDVQVAPVELRDRISLARYLHAITEERIIDGAEAELRSELKISDRAIPLEALLPLPEERADQTSPQESGKTTALPFGLINQSVGPMLSRVFKQTDTAFLGISMPTVPPGERVYPIMTDGTTASMTARGSDGPDAGAAKFSVVNATPHRLTGKYIFDLEGVATLGGLLESTLRADLRNVLGYQMDLQVFNGDGTGANINGLLNQLDLIANPADTYASNQPNAVVSWATFKAMFVRLLDGTYSRRESDWRALLGQDTYTILRQAYRGATTNDNDAIDEAERMGVTPRLSFQTPAPAVATVTGQSGASTKKLQSALLNSDSGSAVAPVWQGITMIRDPYTESDKAQVIMTAHMLFDFILRRKDGWKKVALRTET